MVEVETDWTLEN